MSVNDRRASYMNGPRPRVVSNRVADTEKATPRSGASSFQSDNMDQMRGSTSSHRSKLSKEQNVASEKRSERTVVTTREKAQARTRNPVRESAGAGNKGERERSRAKRASLADAPSPNVRKEKEQIDSQSFQLLIESVYGANRCIHLFLQFLGVLKHL